MKKIYFYFTIAALLMSAVNLNAQEVKKLTLQEVIKLAEEQSPNALIAKHRFRSSYWQYRSYQAQFRPTLMLRGTIPAYSKGFDRNYNSISDEYIYTRKNTITDNATLSLSQAIGFTGTTISLRSDFLNLYDFEKEKRTYTTTPVSVRIEQPIRQYNTLRWQTKIEPIRYATAKKTFLSNMEDVHQMAVMNFFSLALAQINKQIAEMNYYNADTLYQIANGRFGLGTISQDELLQMQLSWLNAETNRKQAEMNLRDREIRLRSFLGFNDQVRLELILPNEVPDLQVNAQEVFDLAMANNPEILQQQLTVLQAQSSVAQAKANKGFNASLSASLGLSTSGNDLEYSLQNPSQSQTVNIGFSVPLLDWGRGKGNYRMALSSLELAKVQSDQAIVDFQQNLYLDVAQFNLQAEQVATAAKSDTVAMLRYEVTKQRFLIGKIDVLDLNDADSRKDQNRRAYVQALQNYWNYFYNMRALTLYDFINRKPIETDYEKLLQ